ncbi:MAG: hypothetical protein ACRELG_06815 [Gemmataceae bacterium]
MTKILSRLAGFTIALAALFAVGSGVRSAPNPATPEDAIQRFGGSVTPYFNPDALPPPDDPCKPKQPPVDKTVTFVNSNLTDADLLCLSAALQAINPTKLDLRYTKVTGTGVWRHMHLPNLVDLDMSSTLVDGNGLVDLIRFPNLKYLRLSYNRLLFDRLDEYLAVASAVPSASPIRLHLGHVHMLQTVFFPDAPAPVVIDMPTDQWLDRLAAHADLLKGLDLSSTGVPKKGFAEALRKLTRLVELNLSGNKDLDDDDLAVLGECDRGRLITHLDLSGTCLTSNGLRHLQDYTNLRVLSLAKTRITDDGLPRVINVSKNRNLAKLDLSDTHTCVTPDLLFCIGNLRNLTTLKIAATGINNDGLKVIWNSQLIEANALDPASGSAEMRHTGSLVSLDISRTRVTDKGLVNDRPTPTARFQLLREITYADTKITTGGLQYYQALRINFPLRDAKGEKHASDVLKALR